jgi:hypothetical protein
VSVVVAVAVVLEALVVTALERAARGAGEASMVAVPVREAVEGGVAVGRRPGRNPAPGAAVLVAADGPGARVVVVLLRLRAVAVRLGDGGEEPASAQRREPEAK